MHAIPRNMMCVFKLGFMPIGDLSQFLYECYDSPLWRRPDTIMVWGCNPVFSNSDGTLGHWVVECQKRGSEIITIDPRLTWMASKTKIWIPVRPGTDGALALAMNNVISQEGLIDEEFISKWTYGHDEYKAYLEQFTPEWAAKICDANVDLIYDAARMVLPRLAHPRHSRDVLPVRGVELPV